MMFSRKTSVFLSYSREDEHWLIELEKHLEPLRLSHLIESWHDGHISPGEEWDLQIKNQIDRAEIILLLISVDFINSRYCNEVQLVKAVERHLSGKARVIPIILRHCTWEIVPVGNLQLGQLQALPKDRKPISTFTNPDEAFSNIAKELLEVIHQNNSEHILRANSAIDESTISPTINEKEGILSEIKKIAKSFKSRENTITSHKLEEMHRADEDQNQIGLDEEGIQSMHKLLMLDDAKLFFIQEPFLTDFISTYWDKIALAYPITGRDFGEASYFEVINMGYTVDWLFAIVPDPKHPLDVDWIFLRPRQAHPWHYGNHPATDNFNGGGSTSCFCEMLSIIELLAKDERIFSYCSYTKGFYDGNPPKTFENFYRNDLFRNAQNLGASDPPNIENRDNRERQMHKEICLGLYGCNAATLKMEWEVESLISGKRGVHNTTELADKVTLALRLAGKSDHYTKIPPYQAFKQWMGKYEDKRREPIILRLYNDVFLCNPKVDDSFCFDAYFLDCENQTLERLGCNGGNPKSILETWGINANDKRLEFLFRSNRGR